MEIAIVVEYRNTIGFHDDPIAILRHHGVFKSNQMVSPSGSFPKQQTNVLSFLRRHKIKWRFAKNLFRLVPQHVPNLCAYKGIDAIRIDFPDAI